MLAGDAPAAGVTVTITSPVLQQPRTATTSAHGFYWIGALPPGTYEVSFSRSGLSSLTRPALLELGRIARADARLEVNEDEDSVTSTAVPLSVVDTTAITTHFSDDDLDRLPLRYDRLSAALLAPGALDGPLYVDDAPVKGRPFLGYEVVEQLTVLRAALPLEFEDENAIVARTRSGGEEFSLSIRDTWFQHEGHLFESASGGSIVDERLWFFAGGWSGVTDGLNVKLTGQAGAAHNFVATYLDADTTSVAALRYSGVLNERLTAEAIVSDEELVNARASYFLGDHVLVGGVSEDALYAGDRWSRGRFAVNAGLRFDDGISPRAAAIFDVRGNGRQALTASFSDYDRGGHVASAGFLTAIGQTGSARVDVLRRNGNNEVQFDARYSLFGRLHTGGSYTHSDSLFGNYGSAWFGAQLPIGEHEAGATLLERYELESWATDVAVRYAIPFPRFRLTFAADVTNVLASNEVEARAVRLWIRARL